MSATLWFVIVVVIVGLFALIVGAALVSGSRFDDAHGYDEVQ